PLSVRTNRFRRSSVQTLDKFPEIESSCRVNGLASVHSLFQAPLSYSSRIVGLKSVQPHAHTTLPSGLPQTSSKSTSVPLYCFVQVVPSKCTIEPFVPTIYRFCEDVPQTFLT